MAIPYNYTYGFDFEKNFDHQAFTDWIRENWKLSFWYSAVYIILVFFGRSYMDSRPRFEIRTAMALWSGFLGIFSILGMLRSVPEMVFVLIHYGWEYSICDNAIFEGPISFWAYLFTISKVYELGDTLFIVLRKQPLIFLHWYHHVSVLIYSWYSYTEHTAPGRWFMVMNYAVHSFMYTYYTFKAMRFRVPRWISICITFLQISQMGVGCIVNISTYRVKTRGGHCMQSYENIKYSSLMYLSYFLLFAVFFYTTYMKKKIPDRNEDNTKRTLSCHNEDFSKIKQNGHVLYEKKLK